MPPTWFAYTNTHIDGGVLNCLRLQSRPPDTDPETSSSLAVKLLLAPSESSELPDAVSAEAIFSDSYHAAIFSFVYDLSVLYLFCANVDHFYYYYICSMLCIFIARCTTSHIIITHCDMSS